MKKELMLVVGALIVVVLVAAFFFLPKKTSVGLISGTIDLNGVVPDGGSIVILSKKSGDTNYQTVVPSVAAVDGSAWQWNNAVEGQDYTLKAELVAGGKVITDSTPLTVTATATEEVLSINSTYVPPPSIVTISGTIDLNGSVTSQSSIAVYEKQSGQQDYSLVQDSLPAQDGASWSWNQATAGTMYDIKAVLTVDGAYAGESTAITVAAPAEKEVLTINSQYNPPPKTVSISGSFNINGQFASGTTLSLFKKSPTDSSFVQVASNLSPTNGTSWSWSGASAGTQYSIQAIAYLNGNNIAQSQIISVAAPAANETLTINTGIPTGQPPNSPTVQCVSQSGNTWTVNVNFQAVNGANRYWVQVGTQPRGNNTADYQTNSTGQSTQTYTFSSINNGTTYYAQYASSTCSGCTQASAYSPFSNVLQFACFPATATPTPLPPSPQPTYTPYPTPTAVPSVVPTATSTPNPTPTLPPRTSSCNQSCGGNGFSCATGLQCVSSGLIGGNVCRNPNCTAQTDCTCN